MENKFMQAAINEAYIAARAGEVPVGAVIFSDGKPVSCAHNETIARKNPCAHAELLAIERAFSILGCYRLDNCSLYVTLEPCAMCAGAIMLARLKSVYFGAYDTKEGALGGRMDVARALDRKTEIYGGICEQECSSIIKTFFEKNRT